MDLIIFKIKKLYEGEGSFINLFRKKCKPFLNSRMIFLTSRITGFDFMIFILN
jgi:hypothetical protein